jgi:hypothetical protein
VKKFAFLITTALLAITTLTAQAENWVEITSSPDGGVKQYLDVDSIERHLGTVVLWRVFDYQPPYMRRVNGKAYRSQRVQTEFECDSRAMRQKYFAWHDEPMGKGPIHHEDSAIEWEIDSFDEFTLPLWKMACE